MASLHNSPQERDTIIIFLTSSASNPEFRQFDVVTLELPRFAAVGLGSKPRWDRGGKYQGIWVWVI